MEPYWVRCGHCGAHSSPVTSTQLYLTSCGHFSCSSCLQAAPLPQPPSTGYCYDCKKPCAVVNLSNKHKLSSDVSFYFQDPGPLLHKMIEVYNFQKVHRQRKYEDDLKERLLEDINAIRSMRERAEPYLQLYGKVYEVLYKKYGVKPQSQKCEITSAEMDAFIGEVARIKQELDAGMGGASRLGEVTTPSGRANPPDISMTTPTMTPAQRAEGSSMFRARVQSEMRSGGARSTGNVSQCSTPAGSVCSKPSPLLTDKRAPQSQITPGSGDRGVRTTPGRGAHTTPGSGGRGVRTTPGRGAHTTPGSGGRGVRTTPGSVSASHSLTSLHPSRSMHLSSLHTPSPSGNWSIEQQRQIQSGSSTRSPAGLRRTSQSFQDPCLASTPLESRGSGPMDPRVPGSMGSVSSSRWSASRLSLPREQLLGRPGVASSTSGKKRLSVSPQLSQRSCSPMSVGGTPASMASIHPSQTYRTQSPAGSTGLGRLSQAAAGSLGKGLIPPNSMASGSGKLPLSSCHYGNGSHLQRPSRVGVSTHLPPPQTVGLHSVPRKPLSGPEV